MMAAKDPGRNPVAVAAGIFLLLCVRFAFFAWRAVARAVRCGGRSQSRNDDEKKYIMCEI